jgi:hypothetical protein
LSWFTVFETKSVNHSSSCLDLPIKSFTFQQYSFPAFYSTVDSNLNFQNLHKCTQQPLSTQTEGKIKKRKTLSNLCTSFLLGWFLISLSYFTQFPGLRPKKLRYSLIRNKSLNLHYSHCKLQLPFKSHY